MKRSKGAILLFGSSDDCVDIPYLTGLTVTDPVILLVKGRERFLVVPPLEQGRAQRVAAGARVMTPQDLNLRGTNRRRLSGWAVGLLRAVRVRRVWVEPRFPVGVARRLERAGVTVHVSDEPLFPEREVKTAEEIARIKEAQQAAVIAMRAAVGMIGAAQPDAGGGLRLERRPLTAQDVRRAIHRALLDQNCAGRDTIVAGGRQAADPHETGSGVLRANEAIVIDIFPRHIGHGYWGDLTRTVVKGEPAPALRRMYAAVRAAQQAALARIRPGVKTASVHRCAVEEFRKRGFKTEVSDGRPAGFIHSTGHGVGLAIHEGPGVGPGPGRLRSGHVITVEPGLYYPEIGGIRIEDTVVVTPRGWRYLAPCEKKFEL
ncbi:MAG: aminopeptidase P family protein [Kiritimatiellae bacterium]|nr:aminopeptidase P family protein [Kiritimatiellia bacterium]